MRLRSDSRASRTPIPLTLPDTHAISISNTSSLLLRLPQELKDRIYQFVYGGSSIRYRRCHLRSSKRSPCYDETLYDYCLCLRGREGRLVVASLSTCRQMYHEARNVVYSANTFEISHPTTTRRLLRRLGDVNYPTLAMRTIYLDVHVVSRNEERKWDNAFHDLAENFKNLRNLYIDLHESFWNCSRNIICPYNPTYGKIPFLRGLLELKQLSLKTVEISMFESKWDADPDAQKEHTWTMDQKRAWAQSLERAILGKD